MTDESLDLTQGTTLIAMALGPESGIVQVEGRSIHDGQDYVVVRNDCTTMHIPLANAAKVLRMPISRDQAGQWLARLRDTEPAIDDRTWSERYAEYETALLANVDDQFVELLRGFYASPYTASRGEQRLIWAFERILVEEIALVLGLAAADLVGELHTAHAATGTFAPSAPQRSAC